MVRPNVFTVKEPARTAPSSAVFVKAQVGNDAANAAAHLSAKGQQDVPFATEPAIVRPNVFTAREPARTAHFSAAFVKAPVGNDAANAAVHP
jgi:hypothetical protein